jgi:hypothetical protein
MGLSGPDADVADNDPGVFGGGFGISGGGEGGIGAGSGVGGIGPGIGGGGFGTSGMPGEGDAGEGGGGNCACIIISACTSRNSPEVNITRAYRDEFLDHQTLAGYYLLATFVVPLIKRYSAVKWLVKKILVDRIVDYCDFQMGGREEMKLKTSKFITEKFLGFCRILGRPVYWILRASRVIQV